MEDIKNIKVDLNFGPGAILLYQIVRGSHSHGTATEKSDIDTMSVYLNPITKLLGFSDKNNFYIADEKNDNVGYELSRYLELLVKSNPTMIESLFVSDDCVIYKHPIMNKIIAMRDSFLSKDALKSFSSYAIEQIKKARGYNKLCAYPEDMERKQPIDFCYTFRKQGTQPIQNWLEEHGLKQIYCGLNHLPNMNQMYGVYYDWGQHIHMEWKTTEEFAEFMTTAKGIHWVEDIIFNIDRDIYNKLAYEHGYDTTEDTKYNYQKYLKAYKEIKPKGYHGIVKEDGSSCYVHLDSIIKDDRPICWMSYNDDGFQSHCKLYKNWSDWKRLRNETRYKSNFGEGYDCYVDDETMFLTKNGWKKYDEISNNELVGCFNTDGTVKFSPILNRFDDLYTGKIYTFENAYLRYSVTPNHNLFVSKVYRNDKYIPYSKNINNIHWFLDTIENLRSNFANYYQLTCLSNNKEDDPNYTDEELMFLGAFLSEGTFLEGYGTEIRISQLETGKMTNMMRELCKTLQLKEYSYNKRGKGNELTWVCRIPKIVNMCKSCNGKYSYEKGLPVFVYDLSKRQFDLLFNAMVLGDGSVNKKNGNITYYTYSKKLANDLNALLHINGYNCQVYGGEKGYTHRYPSNYTRKDGKILGCYQVYVSKVRINNGQPFIIHNVKYKKQWTETDVVNKRIVCFETEYGTLITKNNNKVAFHGNSKNLSETVRLLTMACELAEGKGFNVDRRITGDREYLLDIKKHKYTYEQLIEAGSKLEERLNNAMKTCTLPEHVDTNVVEDLLVNIRKELYNL